MASHSSLDLNQIQAGITGTVQTLQVQRGLLLMLKYADPLFKTRKSEKPFPKQKPPLFVNGSVATIQRVEKVRALIITLALS